MNELFGIVSELPLFYLAPLLVFGPVFLLVLYNLGLKEIINPSSEIREQRRRIQEEAAHLTDDRREKISATALKKRAARRTPMQWAGQALTFTLFALVTAYFSNAPQYIAHPPEMAKVKLSFTHAGKQKEKCRKRTRQELLKLAKNMRTPMKCPRERWPVIVDLVLDGKNIYQGIAFPAGLSKDGHSSFYQAFTVATGSHRIKIGMWDNGKNGEGGDYDYLLEKQVVLSPTEILVIGFDNAAERITLE